MRKELKYNPLDLQGLEISNAVVNTFPTKTDAQNYFTLKSFGVEQKGMQVIFLDTLKTAKWDGTQFIERSYDIEIVENFSTLPDPTTVVNKFYWASNSQGTKWLSGSLGGTYYPKGIYYSNGADWEFIETPYQSTQSEVNVGTNTDTFVTPKTLKDSIQWNTKRDLYTWEYLVANWSVEPSLNTAISGGDVYDYTLNGTTRYRFVPTTYNPTQDAFYADFDGTTLTDLIITRG